MTHGPPLAAIDPVWQRLLQAARGEDIPLNLPPGEGPLLTALYTPLLRCPADRPLVFAHLAQSLDGRIALDAGQSQWLSGPEDLDHTHRLRALADAVLVGASTVELDNPRLTVRRVPGDSPLRVVLDPQLRLGSEHTLFDADGPETLIICSEQATGDAPSAFIPLPEHNGVLSPHAILAALHARGIRRLMVEGGGVTVSRFLAAGCLDRLHLVVAPVLLGQGRPSLRLDEIASLDDALRPIVTRHVLGQDTLFDCDFSAVAR